MRSIVVHIYRCMHLISPNNTAEFFLRCKSLNICIFQRHDVVVG